MRVLKFIGLTTLSILAVLVVVYWIGPKPTYGPLESTRITQVDLSPEDIDSLVRNQLIAPDQKPDNKTRIYWADSVPTRTRYSIVYLHGFSASPEEGDPTYVEFGKRYGFNVYVPLLAGHGLDTKESFADITPNDWINGAKEALAIGQVIGDDVILMSCSTGSTLALYLASENKELIDYLYLYSPNIAIADPTAKMITGPWGKEIAYQVGGKYRSWKKPGEPLVEKDRYWTHTYRIEGIIAVQSLIDQTMTKAVLSKVSQPYFLGYYYKNEEEKDQTVSIEAMNWFEEISQTSDGEKRLVAFPDVAEHVMTSSIQSKDVESVLRESYAFAEEVLGLKPL